jgi:hypothetical protein
MLVPDYMDKPVSCMPLVNAWQSWFTLCKVTFTFCTDFRSELAIITTIWAISDTAVYQ